MERLICSSAEFAEIIEETIKAGGCVPLVVTGNSMNPYLRHGENTVWLKSCTESDFKRGKILLFRRLDGKIVLHRIRKVLPDDELLINGDAQYWCEKIKKEQAVAVVTHIETDGKKKSCNYVAYRIKIEIWQLLKPLRPYIFKIQRKIKNFLS